MIYFSDLDRTLIYSKKFIKDRKDITCIELLDGEEISYISNTACGLLKKLMEKNKFIPTTTRSISQYKRIMFDKMGINFDYSITTNGGNILYKGEVLKSWNDIVRKELQRCNSLEDTMEYFERNYSSLDGMLKIRSVDQMFFYLVVDLGKFDFSKLDTFREKLENFNWNYYVSGRKVYFLPKLLTKENAVAFLMKKLGQSEFYALGDSFMDLNMLNLADRAFVPAKSAVLEEKVLKERAYISENEGFKGIEEIISSFEF